jgi:hypothetical protein
MQPLMSVVYEIVGWNYGERTPEMIQKINKH